MAAVRNNCDCRDCVIDAKLALQKRDEDEGELAWAHGVYGNLNFYGASE